MNESTKRVAIIPNWRNTLYHGQTPEQRFWKMVDKDGPIPEHVPHLGKCWIWKHVSESHPYGTFKIKGVNIKPHRMSYLIHHGELDDNLEICHRCDRTSCVNPEHIFEDTHESNIRDMFSKNRANRAKGSNHYEAKLTEEKVTKIKQMISDGVGTKIIAEKFGVTMGCIGHIKAGRSWKHIKTSMASPDNSLPLLMDS